MPKFLREGIFAILFSLVFALQFNIDDPDGGGAGDPPADPPQDPPADDSTPPKDDDNGKKDGLDGLDPKVQKMIKDLRSENAKYRTKSKESGEKLDKFMSGMKSALGLGEEDQVSPEEQVSALTSHNAGLEMQNAVLGVALENGLNKDQSDYLQFLIEKEASNLDDDDEEGLSEEALASLVAKVKGASASGTGSSGSSTVDEGGETPPPAGTGNKDLTVEAFAKMGYMAKVNLMKTNKAQYDKLSAEARRLKLY